MTAKKTVKSAKSRSAASGSKKQVAAKPKAASGLLGKLKNALSGKKSAAGSAKKSAAPSASAKTKVAAKAKSSTSERSSGAKPAARAAGSVATSTGNSNRPTPSPTSTRAAASPAAARPTRTLPPGAVLTEEDIKAMPDEDYMNDAQLEFFRRRLLQMRQEVLQREMDVKERLHEREVFADPADRATAEEEHWLDLRLRERESLLLRKIDDALRRIESKEYGYCEKTGDPIGIPRLLARPTATVCVDVKGQDERVEAQYRDR
ncbi:RNA polymerase-binding protein DksA [Fontimonas thermophila]|uniref:RNA polymerase-binding protein DksA n=1 Tax=Fontimonas thermophila TaxID=1076937 RepID=UPI001F249E1A|nr:RNA polymerase-binding protein DksA [Fontimonas thermophila]